MENTQVVNQEPMTEAPASEGVTTQNQGSAASEETVPSAQAGTKTDPNLLLKSLQEEREKRKQLEEQLKNLTTSDSSIEEEAVSDEGRRLAKKINSLESEISNFKGELAERDIVISYPVLKDKWVEFEEFHSLPDNKGMNLRTAAKAFLIENGMLEAPRKGLEKPTGGPRVPLSTSMSSEDIKTLRETNFRRYQDMLEKGQIKF